MPPASTLLLPMFKLRVILSRTLAAASAIAALWVLTYIDLEHDRTLLERATLTRVQGYAVSYAESLHKGIQQIDQMSLTLVRLHEAGVSPEVLNTAYRGILDELPLYPIYLDEKGIARYLRRPPAVQIDLSAREFFQYHRSSTSTALRINPRETGIGVFEGQQIVRLTRRVNRPDGSFGGVVAITMLPRYLNAFSDTSMLQTNDFASVWLLDGPMLTNRTQGWGDRIVQRYRERPQVSGEYGARREDADRFFTGGAHLVGWRQLRDYPLIALVGVSEDNVLSTLDDSRATHYGAAMLGCLLILLLAGSNARGAIRRRVSRERIARAAARYRHAVDSVREAVFVFEPCPAADGVTTDFRIEDCNAPATRLADISRQQAIGRRTDELFAAEDAFRLRSLMQAALLDGTAKSEMKSERHGQAVWYFVLAERVDTSIALTMRDVTELKTREQQVQAMALSDPLTLVHNRLWLSTYLPGAIRLAGAESRKLALFMLDIDDFKLINDTLGHRVGDDILVASAVALRRALRESDHVARIGGDSFAVLIEQLDERQGLEAVSRQLRGALDAIDWPAPSAGITHRFSTGVAVWPDDGADAVALIRAAELALHAARRAGDGLTHFYDHHLMAEREQRLWLESALPQAIRGGELRLLLQPRVSTNTGRLRSFEALVRWQHPQRGLLMPSAFIPVAEETGAIVALGEWMLTATCALLGRWREQQRRVVPVAVNVSALQLKNSDFRKLLVACLDKHALPASLLALELTESVVVGDDPVILTELRRLRDLGVEICIDDFGTGYSSLAQLQRVDIDCLKVDQSFVRALGARGQGRQLCEAVIRIGKSLGATVVAEGVETLEQFALLRSMGCDEIQGYLAAKPLPPEEAIALLNAPLLIAAPSLTTESAAGH